MKRNVGVLAVSLFMMSLAVGANAQETGIRFFEGTWNDVLAEAGKQNKPIYLDCYTTWCGPCKMLKKEVFTDAKVGAYFNENYICYSLDMEKGEGLEIAKKYDVRGYPTHLYFDAKGDVVHRTMGAGNSDQYKGHFIQWAKDARDPSKQFYALKKRYDAGDRDPDMLYVYARSANDAGTSDAKDIAKAYFATQSEDDLYNQKNWDAIKNLIFDFDFKEYYFVLQHKDEFVKRYGVAEVNDKILGIALNEAYRAKSKLDYGKGLFEKNHDVLTQVTKPEEIAQLYRTYMRYYEVMEDWPSYATTASEYLDHGKVDDWNDLNEIAWAIYEHSDDPAMIARAEKWAARSVELQSNYFNNDTHAALLHKLGRNAEAEKAAERAIELGNQDGSDVSATEDLLAKIKQSM